MNLRHRTPGRWCRLLLLGGLIVLPANQFASAQTLNLFEVSPSSPTLNATLTPGDGGIVRLELHLRMPPGGATYSQDPSFSQATTFKLSDVTGLVPVEDKYTPDHQPKRGYDRRLGETVEKFTGEVTWTRRFRLQPGRVPESVSIRGTMEHLYCDANACALKTRHFVATLGAEELAAVVAATPAEASPADTTATTEAGKAVYDFEFTPTRGGVNQPVDLRFQLLPDDAQPGDHVTLSITMTLHDDWHTFDLEKGAGQLEKPTEIEIGQTHNLRPIGEFATDHPAELLDGSSRVFHNQVTFSREFEVIEAGSYGISGTINFQICKTQCILRDTDFTLGVVPVKEAVAVAPAPDTGSTGAPGAAAAIDAFQLVEESAIPSSLWLNLVFAFLGGLILNVMPCVLPVLAVKVLSFVQQAGESRERILALNISYSIGVVSVFTVLACLAVFLGYGWGELFQLDEFNLIMAAIVFAMGLSLLGVFELPVPGMIGSAAGGQHREGLPGAFTTGIFATLLATPCSGPFMGTTLAWSVKQPMAVTFLIWIVMGIGMASPYLVLGAFPRLVHWLPKPGMWMVRFKEFAGFVLMGAVVWIMNSINTEMLIPTLIVLIGVALGVWMVGNLYDHTAPPHRKWGIRAAALLLSAGICGYGWSLLYRGHELPWEDFSTARIEQLRDEGKPVLIDFTADWCAICKTNEFRALNRLQTIEFVKQHDIVPIKADYTDKSPEIRHWLDLCNQEGVPLTLIFAKGRPDVAIPLRGLYSQGKLLETLAAAVEGTVPRSELPATSQTADASSARLRPSGIIR